MGACRRAVPSSNSEALWITDDVLAAAFNRFARKHVRHQSHVPGPLEAQKRATRRKKAVLAYAPSPALSPAILFPDRPQSAWWKSQPAQEDRSPKFILPAWLRGREEAAKEETSRQSENWLDFEGDLACCESPTDLRALVRSYELNLRVNTAQAETIYEQVLSKGWPTNVVAEYLADPVLSPPGSRNHLRILREFERDIGGREVEDSRRFDDWSIMLQGICKAVRLGLLSDDEWMQAVDTALAICAKINGCETYRNTEGLNTLSSASVVLSLLESLKMCPVLDPKHIDFTWLETLPARAMGNGFNSRIVKLLKVTGLKRDVPLIVNLLMKSLQRPNIDTRPELLSTAEALPGLGHATLLKVLGQATADLMEGSIAGNTPPTTLVSWMCVLRTLNGEVNGEFKYRVRLTDHDAHFLTPMTGRFQRYSPDTAALVLWTVHQLYDPTASDANFEPPDCLSVLRRVIHPADAQTKRGIHAAIIDAIGPLPLPDKQSLISRLPTFLRLHTGYQESDLHGTFAKFIAGDLAQITHTATYCYMRKNHPQALRHAVQRVNKDLPGFRRLVRHTIANNKLLFKVIVRIMTHNTSFRKALKRSWSPTDPGFGFRRDGTRAWATIGPRDQEIIDHKKPSGQEVGATNKAGAGSAVNVDPAEALDTLHFLTVNFAASKAVPARTALSKVYWCYKLLVRSRAPVHHAVSRALWHAGFERGSHCRPARLAWLLRKVREIEGPEVALELARNPEFRRKRKEGFEKVAKWGEGSEDFGCGKGHLPGEMHQLKNDETKWMKEYEQMEITVKEVMAWEADDRIRKHMEFAALPEQPSVQEFDRWLAGRAEAIDNEEGEDDDLSKPLWLWDQGPAWGRAPEAGIVNTTWQPLKPQSASSLNATAKAMRVETKGQMYVDDNLDCWRPGVPESASGPNAVATAEEAVQSDEPAAPPLVTSKPSLQQPGVIESNSSPNAEAVQSNEPAAEPLVNGKPALQPPAVFTGTATDSPAQPVVADPEAGQYERGGSWLCLWASKEPPAVPVSASRTRHERSAEKRHAVAKNGNKPRGLWLV